MKLLLLTPCNSAALASKPGSQRRRKSAAQMQQWTALADQQSWQAGPLLGDSSIRYGWVPGIKLKAYFSATDSLVHKRSSSLIHILVVTVQI